MTLSEINQVFKKYGFKGYIKPYSQYHYTNGSCTAYIGSQDIREGEQPIYMVELNGTVYHAIKDLEICLIKIRLKELGT